MTANDQRLWSEVDSYWVKGIAGLCFFWLDMVLFVVILSAFCIVARVESLLSFDGYIFLRLFLLDGINGPVEVKIHLLLNFCVFSLSCLIWLIYYDCWTYLFVHIQPDYKGQSTYPYDC